MFTIYFIRNVHLISNDNFTKLVDIHCQNIRGSFAKFHVSNVNSFNITSFYYSGIKEWNHLPDSIKAIENKHRFKEVKRQLFKNMTEFILFNSVLNI